MYGTVVMVQWLWYSGYGIVSCYGIVVVTVQLKCARILHSPCTVFALPNLMLCCFSRSVGRALALKADGLGSNSI